MDVSQAPAIAAAEAPAPTFVRPPKPAKFQSAAHQLRYYTIELLETVYDIASIVGKTVPLHRPNMEELLSTELVPAEFIAAYVRILDKAIGPLLDSEDEETQMTGIAKICTFVSDDKTVEEMIGLVQRVDKVLRSEKTLMKRLLVGIAILRKISNGIKMPLPPGMAAPAAPK